MRTPPETIDEFVAAFIAAWPSGDANGLGQFFGEDAIYHNGPLEPVVGRDAIVETLAAFMRMGGTVRVDIAHTVSNGSMVMIERVDSVALPGRTVALPVMGVFEITDGRIDAWRDYFDLGAFNAQME